MKRIHIIGGKNSGKTSLVADLVKEFTRLGLRVGTIKHTHHQHELDTPGKDSHRHREAGAAVVGILSRSMNAVFWPPGNTAESERDHRYASFEPCYAQCDLVLVEGDTRTSSCKIEVWRESLGTRPLAEQDKSIAAIITDDGLQMDTPIWPRSDIAAIAKRVLSLVANHV